jgi:hypothetical protein
VTVAVMMVVDEFLLTETVKASRIEHWMRIYDDSDSERASSMGKRYSNVAVNVLTQHR